MRILITGAAGFIGTHLAKALDHDVIGVDRSDADLAIPYRTSSLIEGHKPDMVVHLGARYGRILCRDEPHRAVLDNAAGTTELAATCAKFGIPVLYASSSEVYGDHGEDLITEESELRTPTTIYGLSKRWGEEVLRLYLHPDQLCIVRLNMLYGPEQRGGYGCCALATFIRDALGERPLTVHNGASRSWLYISDAVRALELLIDQRGVFHIGHPHERVTMTQTAEMVFEAVGCAPHVDYVDPPEGQIKHKNYDISRLQALGWESEVPLAEGIARTVEWARANEMRDYQGDSSC